MSQTYVADPYVGTGKTAETVMDDINDCLAALRSGFSGASAPAAVGGQIWHDSTARKIRDYADANWLVSLLGDASFIIPVYRNDTCEGWLIDTNNADRIIAISNQTAHGGSGSGTYNVAGGTQAGTWTYSGLTADSHAHSNGTLAAAAHGHKVYEDGGVSGDGQTYNSSGTLITIGSQTKSEGKAHIVRSSNSGEGAGDMWTSRVGADVTGSTSLNSANVSSDGSHRIAASVCTMQYPNLT